MSQAAVRHAISLAGCSFCPSKTVLPPSQKNKHPYVDGLAWGLAETQVAGQICPVVWSEMLMTVIVALDGLQNVCGAVAAAVLSVQALKISP